MSKRNRRTIRRTNREKLELFVRLAREFNLSEAAQRGMKVGLKQTWSRETQALVTQLTQPNETDVRAMLLDLRKFIANESDVYVQVIHGLVYKALVRDGDTVTAEQMRKVLGLMNTQWRKNYESGFMKLTINGKEYSPERAMNLWLNGRYFHDDPEYAAFLDALDQSDSLAANMIRWQFLEAAVDTANYVTWLAQNVDYFLLCDLLDNNALG